jgi:hypothetical protein
VPCPRRGFAALAVVIVAAVAAAPALGAQLAGNPMTVHVGELGQLQAFRASEPSGIFFPPTSEIGDAGLFLALPGPGPGSGTVFGFPVTSSNSGITDYTAGTQGATTGSGTTADPLTQVTNYTAGTTASVKQTTTYVNGAQEFLVRWEVTNTSGAPLNFKAMAAADFFFDGSDVGTGIFTNGPPRFIGGTNADSGRSGGFVEVLSGSDPWSTYQALEFGDEANQVWGKIMASAGSASATFDGSVIGEPVDNAGAVEWDQFATGAGLAASGTATFAVVVRTALPSALQLSPTNAGAPQGVPVNISARATDTSGAPYAGKTLRYTITGVNPSTGALTLGPNGNGTITDPGTNAGNDTIVAFVDFNNNSAREPVEPQASALATFVDNVAPGCTVRVSGDRPGGGGAGKPLVITVNCNEAAAVTVSTTLTPLRARRSVDSRARAIRLRKVTRTVAPGKRFAFRLKIPRRVARKYAGQKLRATITVSAKDSTGNVKRKKTRRTVKLRARR